MTSFVKNHVITQNIFFLLKKYNVEFIDQFSNYNDLNHFNTDK